MQKCHEVTSKLFKIYKYNTSYEILPLSDNITQYSCHNTTIIRGKKYNDWTDFKKKNNNQELLYERTVANI
jgi:hypothetical protein